MSSLGNETLARIQRALPSYLRIKVIRHINILKTIIMNMPSGMHVSRMMRTMVCSRSIMQPTCLVHRVHTVHIGCRRDLMHSSRYFNKKNGGLHRRAQAIEQQETAPSPSDYVQYCNTEYGIPYLVDFGLLHESNAVDIADPRSSVNMTYDEDLQTGQESNYKDGGLPVARLRHPQGSSVDICLHGAAITSWKRPDGSEMLSLNMGNTYDGKEPILGGLTVAWPQLGAGTMPLVNGVLQYLHWSVVETSCWDVEDDPRPSITLYADSEDVVMSPVAGEFSQPFEAMLTVTLGLDEEDQEERLKIAAEQFESTNDSADSNEEEKIASEENQGDTPSHVVPDTDPTFELIYQLSIMNKSTEDVLSFTAGAVATLATENMLEHADTIKFNGLVGKYVLDYSLDPMRPRLEIENDHFIKFDPHNKQKIDRLYVDCPKEGEVSFCPGTQRHFDFRNNKGFTDILVSRPSTSEQTKNEISVAAARKAKPVRLQPGDVWESEVIFKAFDRYWNISNFEMETDPHGIPVPDRSEALPPRKSDD